MRFGSTLATLISPVTIDSVTFPAPRNPILAVARSTSWVRDVLERRPAAEEREALDPPSEEAFDEEAPLLDDIPAALFELEMTALLMAEPEPALDPPAVALLFDPALLPPAEEVSDIFYNLTMDDRKVEQIGNRLVQPTYFVPMRMHARF